MRESELEAKLISKLKELKYTHLTEIRDLNGLEENFRQKFELLNAVKLTDNEFRRLLEDIINPDVFQASKFLREQNFFLRDDDTPLRYTLVNTKEWCKNDFEIVSQLRINTRNSHQRFDVIILINGVPVVQIELKSYEVSFRKAMQQIVDYKNEPGNGFQNSLLCFMQLFIVSNQSNTYYFSNNQDKHFAFNADEQFLPVYHWADENNKKILGLDAFADSFLGKCHLAKIISRYMVLVATEQKLLVMRPYQIYAVQAIVNSIRENRGNGYIWHTTGSGKTLTSFKASTLLKENPNIEKCLFVVDRKDLDRQTRQEFNKFQDKCVEDNANTETLVRRMLSQDYSDKVIVTTIQKLGLALDSHSKKGFKDRLKPLANKRMVFIFDECHRSQFGENHKAIKEFFPKAQLFGFTGTPIFQENASYTRITGEEAQLQTTKDIFQNELHTYTITEAIDDRNVLKFHIDYFTTEGKAKPRPGEPYTRQAVVEAILAKHDAATHQRRFNAILATSSINEAIDYYNLFKEVQKQKANSDPEYWPLNIACVFSPPPGVSDEVKQIQEDLDQEKKDNQSDPGGKQKALEMILADYNKQYNTNHKISEFDQYYQDVQKRIKDQQFSNQDYAHSNKIDIVIVVDMLLTGFDSKFLNTLYVDKNLRYHGLIQAFSRTNRILNDTKPYGNILDFRQQQVAVDEAITRFSGKEDPNRAKEIWLVDPAPVVVAKFEKAFADLSQFMQTQGLDAKAENVSNLKGDEARGEFIKQFKEVQRLKTQLEQYTDLSEEDKAKVDTLLPKDELLAFKGAYLETAKRLKSQQEKDPDPASPVNQLEFEFVLFATALVDYDYIMGLIAQNTLKPEKERMSRDELFAIIASDAKLMDQKENLQEYVDSLDKATGQTLDQIKQGFVQFVAEKNAGILAEIAKKHGLEVPGLQAFVNQTMDRMIFDGDQLSELLAPLELGWKARTQKELEVMHDLAPNLRRLAEGNEISGLEAYEE